MGKQKQKAENTARLEADRKSDPLRTTLKWCFSKLKERSGNVYENKWSSPNSPPSFTNSAEDNGADISAPAEISARTQQP